MAYFYRLTVAALSVLFVLFWTSDARASIPATVTYSTGADYYFASGTSGQGVCTATVAQSVAHHNSLPPQIELAPWSGSGTFNPANNACSGYMANKNNPYLGFSVILSAVASCPANSTLGGGVCTCAAGMTESNGQCVASLCPAGRVMPTTVDSGWLNSGDLVGAYGVQGGHTSAPGCMWSNMAPIGSSQGCSVTFASSGPPMEHQGSNGHSHYTIYLEGTATGTTCSNPGTPDALGPEPPCAGQSGTFNGHPMCLDPESPESIADRAASAAAAAASAAAAAARNAAGSTPASAAAAAAAAGAAANRAIRTGATASQAAQAGAAAGAASTATCPPAPTPAGSGSRGPRPTGSEEQGSPPSSRPPAPASPRPPPRRRRGGPGRASPGRRRAPPPGRRAPPPPPMPR